MRRKFLLWDHDGTLVDTERWYFAATQHCLASLGVSLDRAAYLAFMAEGRSYWELAEQRGVAADAIVAAKAERDVLYHRFLRERPIEIPGVVEALARLRRLYRMAVVSTARKADIDVIHRERRLLSAFEFVITIEDAAHAKPHPAPYLEALRRFGASPHEALAVEDSSRGLRSALAAGIDCVVVHNEFTSTQDFTGAWRIVASIDALGTLLGA